MSATENAHKETMLSARTIEDWVRRQGVQVDSKEAARLAKFAGRLAPVSSTAGEAQLHLSQDGRATLIQPNTDTVLPKPAKGDLPLTLVGLRRRLAQGEISVESALARQVEALQQDSRWHALTHQFSLEGTADVEAPLSGVGLAHKDIFTMQGRPPHCGTAYVPRPLPGSSPVVAALEAAGSSTLAAVAMPEFASGVTGENAAYPQPVNPIDGRAAVGGSSSGSAVAVAAGLCYGSLGTDTAGSVRIPAATCGVVGLMPSRDLLSREGCFPLSPSLDTVGILARSALDVAQLLYYALPGAVAQGRFPELGGLERDALLGAGDALYDRLKFERAPRIAWVVEHPDFRFSADATQAEALASFAADWSADGCVAHQRLHLQEELTRNANLVMHVEAAATHLDALRGQAPGLGKVAASVAMPGLSLPAAWYAQSLRQRGCLNKAFCEAHFRDADILLTPILPHGVPDWAEVLTDSPDFKPVSLLALFSWTAFVNYLGLPAIVFPIGRDARGRPISVQAIGRPGSESLLLAFAWRFERMHYGLDGVLPSCFQPSFPEVE